MYKSVLVLVALLFPLALFAGWKDKYLSLEQVYKIEGLRIFYTLKGKEALPRNKRADRNRNGVPDYVEDIGAQLSAAMQIYTRVFKLKHPLKTKRYGSVDFIDVHLIGSLKGYNGMAYDGIIKFGRSQDKPGATSIFIDINHKITIENATPAHELFHLFQSGYTMFKNRWFTEGMARWAERIVKFGSGYSNLYSRPSARRDIEKLFKQNYEAGVYFITLSKLAADRMKLPTKIANIRYISSKKRVIKDELVYGAAFMKALLQQLARGSELEAQKHGLKRFFWKERRQKSALNNWPIWQALLKTCGQFKIKCQRRVFDKGSLKAGQQVVAMWPKSKRWYAGRIISINSRRAKVKLADGDIARVRLRSEVRPLDWQVGHWVRCRKTTHPKNWFQRAEILSTSGEQLKVRYLSNDRYEEKRTLAQCRDSRQAHDFNR